MLVREKIDDWQPGKMVKVSWNESDIDAALDQDMHLDVLAYSVRLWNDCLVFDAAFSTTLVIFRRFLITYNSSRLK